MKLTGVSFQRLWYSELAGESLEGLGSRVLPEDMLPPELILSGNISAAAGAGATGHWRSVRVLCPSQAWETVSHGQIPLSR